ncbi:hypothetical protein HPP92_015622 [Vanilla planifolia]|uniref:Uncharacterized protein n=1 Tax=Vanilla planifolia TaxID=51239 RepID=A0A835QHN6_VANPL|nr:hypothetical protein HPP92_016281 [Vanilla planifolia]KAG0471076.1 hypothetical protein HPP92_015622 [Vanilla planifolia]
MPRLRRRRSAPAHNDVADPPGPVTTEKSSTRRGTSLGGSTGQPSGSGRLSASGAWCLSEGATQQIGRRVGPSGSGRFRGRAPTEEHTRQRQAGSKRTVIAARRFVDR